jgi:L-fuculose-phosphate aldolase
MGEIYTGVKFEVEHGPEEVIRDPRVDELMRIGQLLAAQGFCPENSGNLSFRLGRGFVITAAGSELGALTPVSFVLVRDVDISKKKVFCAGKTQPSSEAMMHKMIYDVRGDIEVILHAHALDLRHAVVTEKEFPYGTLEFASAAVAVLKKHDLVILKNHGFVSLGNTVSAAYERLALS